MDSSYKVQLTQEDIQKIHDELIIIKKYEARSMGSGMQTSYEKFINKSNPIFELRKKI